MLWGNLFHCPFKVTLLFLCSCQLFAETSHRIILEGFHDAKIGYEIGSAKFLAKFLFAGGVIGDDNLDLRGDVRIGMQFRYSPGIEYAWTIGCRCEYAQVDYSSIVYEKDLSASPSLNMQLYKYFGRIFIGGNAALDLWRFQKQSRNDYESSWHGSRIFDIEPEFIVGFRFW